MLRARMLHKLSILLVLVFAGSACAPRLGDGCETSTDCSVQGDRFCDLAQPGGYCTVLDCSPGGCGDEGLCVRFKPDEPRLSRDWCMAKCSDTRDCDRDRYVCHNSDQINPPTEDDAGVPISPAPLRVAEVLDRKTNAKFCVVKKEGD